MNEQDNVGVADAYTDIVGNNLPTNDKQEFEERTRADSGPLSVKDDRLWEDEELTKEGGMGY